MSWGQFFYPHTVQIERLRASGGLGSEWETGTSESVEVKDEQRLVRNADGDEVVSSTSVTIALPTDVPLGSRVTVWPGADGQRRAKVLAVERNENAPPLDSYLVLRLE